MKICYRGILIILVAFNMIFALIYSVFCLFNGIYGAIIFKGLSSILFVTIGIFTCRFPSGVKENKYLIFIILGLMFGMFGDVILQLPTQWSFVAGASSFAVGHILYSIAFCYVKRISGKHIFIFIISSILFVSYVTFMPYIETEDMYGIVVAYCLIISFMVGGAVSLWDSNMSVPKKMCVVGAILFLISDLILLHSLFIPTLNAEFLVFFNTFTYYPGQLFIAMSLLDPFKRSNKNVNLKSVYNHKINV